MAAIRVVDMGGSEAPVEIDLDGYSNIRFMMDPAGPYQVWTGTDYLTLNAASTQAYVIYLTPDGANPATWPIIYNLDYFPEKIWMRAIGGAVKLRFMMW